MSNAGLTVKAFFNNALLNSTSETHAPAAPNDRLRSGEEAAKCFITPFTLWASNNPGCAMPD
jgi:hypothetical protein